MANLVNRGEVTHPIDLVGWVGKRALTLGVEIALYHSTLHVGYHKFEVVQINFARRGKPIREIVPTSHQVEDEYLDTILIGLQIREAALGFAVARAPFLIVHLRFVGHVLKTEPQLHVAFRARCSPIISRVLGQYTHIGLNGQIAIVTGIDRHQHLVVLGVPAFRGNTEITTPRAIATGSRRAGGLHLYLDILFELLDTLPL